MQTTIDPYDKVEKNLELIIDELNSKFFNSSSSRKELEESLTGAFSFIILDTKFRIKDHIGKIFKDDKTSEETIGQNVIDLLRRYENSPKIEKFISEIKESIKTKEIFTSFDKHKGVNIRTEIKTITKSGNMKDDLCLLSFKVVK